MYEQSFNHKRKEVKSNFKITLIYDSSTKGIRLQVCVWPLFCCLGTSYFWWVENEPLKEWSWKDLFLLGSAAKSADSNSGISKLSTGLRDQCWFLHEILVLLRSTEKSHWSQWGQDFIAYIYLLLTRVNFRQSY